MLALSSSIKMRFSQARLLSSLLNRNHSRYKIPKRQFNHSLVPVASTISNENLPDQTVRVPTIDPDSQLARINDTYTKIKLKTATGPALRSMKFLKFMRSQIKTYHHARGFQFDLLLEHLEQYRDHPVTSERYNIFKFKNRDLMESLEPKENNASTTADAAFEAYHADRAPKYQKLYPKQRFELDDDYIATIREHILSEWHNLPEKTKSRYTKKSTSSHVSTQERQRQRDILLNQIYMYQLAMVKALESDSNHFKYKKVVFARRKRVAQIQSTFENPKLVPGLPPSRIDMYMLMREYPKLFKKDPLAAMAKVPDLRVLTDQQRRSYTFWYWKKVKKGDLTDFPAIEKEMWRMFVNAWNDFMVENKMMDEKHKYGMRPEDLMDETNYRQFTEVTEALAVQRSNCELIEPLIEDARQRDPSIFAQPNETTVESPTVESPAVESQVDPESYTSLITKAITHSADKRMTFDEIKEWIMQKFPDYRNKQKDKNSGWQKGIQNALSYYDCFVKVGRQTDHPRKANYWTIQTPAGNMFDDACFLRRQTKAPNDSS